MVILLLHVLLAFMVLSLTLGLVPGLELESIVHLMLAGLILGFINFTLSPLLLSFRIRIKPPSVGIFTFIVNILFLNISTGLIDDFSIKSWSGAVFAAGLLAFIQVFLDYLDPERRMLLR